MKKFLLFIALLQPILLFSQYKNSCFILSMDKNVRTTHLIINKTFYKNDTIRLSGDSNISGLAVSGRSAFMDDNSMVRVILRDKSNFDYLVYESSPLASDNLLNTFRLIAFETDDIATSPSCLIVQTLNASIHIDSINIQIGVKTKRSDMDIYKRLRSQHEAIADVINRNLIKNKKHWRAGVTKIACMSYEEKKSTFGENYSYLGGFEYYTGGVFVPPVGANGRMLSSQKSTTDAFVKEWDWRNRHGKNWMSPAKHQNSCQSCWAFAAIGTFESYANLYFNNLLNYDLSEQEIVSCRNGVNLGTMCLPSTVSQALSYIKNQGVVTEDCFPYTMRILCENKCDSANEILSVENYTYIHNSSIDTILKKELFRSPITIGIGQYGHAMVLCGYKDIHAGDVIHLSIWNPELKDTIQAGDDLIGQTAWLLKNSCGEDFGENGFIYMIIPKTYVNEHGYTTANIHSTYKLTGKVHSLILSDDDITATDEDGDGYYYWGLGSKPSNLPEWVPDNSDGDDSDPCKGPLDHYGFCEDINPNNINSLNIDNEVLWYNENYIYQNIFINSGGVLTITSQIDMHPLATINIMNGGKLIINGGRIVRSKIIVNNGGELEVKNHGELNCKNGDNILVKSGGLCNFEANSTINL